MTGPDAPPSGPERIRIAVAQARDRAPFVHLTNLALDRVDADRVALRLPLASPLLTGGVAGLGAAAACIADSALVYAVMSAVSGAQTASTTRLSVQMIDGTMPLDGLVRANAQVVAIRSERALVEGTVTGVGGAPVARCTARVQVVPRALQAERSTTAAAREIDWEGRGPLARLDGRTPDDAGAASGGSPYVFTTAASPHFSNAIGVMHGGAIAMLVYEACARATRAVLAGGTAELVDSEIVYLRPAAIEGQPLELRCNVQHSGRRLTVIDGSMWSANRQSVVFRSTFAPDGRPTV